MNHLEMVLGMLAEDIDEDFKAIDENGDSLVSKEEGFKAYGNFGLDRSEGSIYPGGKWKMRVNLKNFLLDPFGPFDPSK